MFGTGDLLKAVEKIQIFFKRGQKYRAACMKTSVRFIAAGLRTVSLQ
jgi:hypothetical protein